MASTFEGGVQPQRHDFLRQARSHDAAADGEDVGVVMRPRHARGVEVVAQRGANPVDFIGSDLFALSAAADDDAARDRTVSDGERHVGADDRVIDGAFAVCAAIVDVVTALLEKFDEMPLELVSRVVAADRDPHSCEIIPGCAVRDARFASRMSEVKVTRRGEERVQSGHPWIYKSDIAEVNASGGEIVRVSSARGRVLGEALFSDRSEIAIRMLSRGDLAADAALLRARVGQALSFRASLDIDATAYRVVHGEGDLLPSLIVDRYGDYLVLQALSQGMDRLLPEITTILQDLAAPAGILARNDPRVRLLEGLDLGVRTLAGEVPQSIEVREGAVTYTVDPWRGQKTGLFLDQRENRVAAARYARGRLLDAFSYNGGFALALAPSCDEVLAVDISEDAVARIRLNAERNRLANIEARAMNVFDELRELERRGERFDTIVLDPPAFAKSKGAVEKALSGYKEINLRALKLLAPGGYLVTCSCSYHVSEAHFADMIADAAADARTDVNVVEKRMQGRDHPVLMTVPETYYLKCFILRKLS